MAFNDDINKYITKYKVLVTNVFQRSCEQVSIDIAEGSPVSKGALLGSWTPSINGIQNDNYRGGQSAWNHGKKNEGIASANREAALSNLIPRVDATTKSLSADDDYYFVNSTSYIKMAEYEGWESQGGTTGPYHMRTNAIQNWQEIVNSRLNG